MQFIQTIDRSAYVADAFEGILGNVNFAFVAIYDKVAAVRLPLIVHQVALDLGHLVALVAGFGLS